MKRNEKFVYKTENAQGLIDRNETYQTSGDDYIDDLVNDLEIECGFSINPAIFSI